MTLIIPDVRFSVMKSLHKTASGGVVASVAVMVVSLFHGLTPEQHSAGFILSVAVLEGVRNILKKKFPKFFFFL